jgi:hypothetical protein
MTLYCKYGCQTPIKFDNSRIGSNGKKIPLNLDDDTIHDCPKRLSLSNKGTLTCKYCTQPITFDNNIKAKSGKMIPLNPDKSYHNCAKSPYSLSKRHVLDNKQEDAVKLSIDDTSSCQRPQVIKDT